MLQDRLGDVPNAWRANCMRKRGEHASNIRSVSVGLE